jgi:hypothetical protein
MADKRDSNSLNTIDENEENSECSNVEKLSKFDKYVYTVLLCYVNFTYVSFFLNFFRLTVPSK